MKRALLKELEYLKDRTGGFDDYYPCRRSGLGDMLHVRKWLSLFAFMHNSVIKSNTKFTNLRKRKGLVNRTK